MLPIKLLTRRGHQLSFQRLHHAWKKALEGGLKTQNMRQFTSSKVVSGPFSPEFEKISTELDLQMKPQIVYEYPENDPEDQILRDPDYFGVKEMVSLHDLFNARVHLGHKAGCRNDWMKDFIFGSRLDVDIIDIEQTLPLLHAALNFMGHIAYRNGVILFIARQPQNIHLVEKLASEVKEYSHCRDWKLGLFSNAISQFGGEIRLPDLCVMLDTRRNAFEDHLAVLDCAKHCIPTIAIMDTNCDPRLISYPIPGNDDTPSAVNLYCDLFKKVILKGKEKRQSDKQ